MPTVAHDAHASRRQSYSDEMATNFCKTLSASFPVEPLTAYFRPRNDCAYVVAINAEIIYVMAMIIFVAATGFHLMTKS